MTHQKTNDGHDPEKESEWDGIASWTYAHIQKWLTGEKEEEREMQEQISAQTPTRVDWSGLGTGAKGRAQTSAAMQDNANGLAGTRGGNSEIGWRNGSNDRLSLCKRVTQLSHPPPTRSH